MTMLAKMMVRWGQVLALVVLTICTFDMGFWAYSEPHPLTIWITIVWGLSTTIYAIWLVRALCRTTE